MKLTLFFLSLCCAGLLAALPVPCHYYRFDGADIKDEIGTCHGTVARLQQADGLYGKALYFPQQDKAARNVACAVSIPLPQDTFTKPFTTSVWIRFDNSTEYRVFREMLSCGGERGPGMRLTYHYNVLSVRTGDGKTPVTVGTNSSTVVLPLEQWFNVTVTYDGKISRIYLDAVLKAEGEMQFTPGKGNLSVGTFRNGYAYPVQGAMDELKIFDRALTPAEVTELYLYEMK